MSFTRRGAFIAASAAILLPRRGLARGDALAKLLPEIEQRLGARFGAYLLDTQSNRLWQHRANERFPMCSTFKALACGAILARVDAGQEKLDRRIVISREDIVSYSPVTETRIGGTGMTLAEVCIAAVTQSDNTAGNILIDSLGGPGGVTDFARGLGDAVTRLDRRETALNEAKPGDPRDTTSPAAMAASLQALALGDRLSPVSRVQFVEWLVANRTGDAKLRAGLPKSWRIGDKTGGGDFGTMNDIALIWPPGSKPVIASLYMTETKASFDVRNAAFAEIGRALAASLAA
ncbi:class A beta-lactamase [Ferrovibrio sp.]|uniref:class A beta-lactamase n=1 Tax=Ferrovibrio sp. TaxID=1917215 RepID=UPI003D0EBB83